MILKKEVKGGGFIEVSNYLLETILSITSSGANTIKLNDIVVSNGRMRIPKGTEGRVTEIYEPFTNGHSNDVIFCEFEDGSNYFMKFKDLEFENGSYVIPRM